MHVSSYSRPLVLWCLVVLGCGGFRPRDYQNTIDLYRESLRRLQAGNAGDAILGFERLTLELSARDTLLPRAHYYLGQAYARNKSWFEAAKAYNALVTLFPEDTLADDAMLETGRAYFRLWPDPELDSQYGEAALAMLGALAENYPTSPLREEAQAEISRIREQLTEKDYRIGEWGLRKGCPSCANIYFKDVVELYPETRRARDAYAKMAEVYKSIGYTEEYKEICEVARHRYPEDKGIQTVCNGAGAGVPPPRRNPGVLMRHLFSGR